MYTITIAVNGILSKVCKHKALNSELIKDLIVTYGEDYIIQFSSKYQDSIKEYVTWLNDDLSLLLCNEDKLQSCFEFESYIHDSNFFTFLIEVMGKLYELRQEGLLSRFYDKLLPDTLKPKYFYIYHLSFCLIPVTKIKHLSINGY
jgi:hypothetical protein